METYDEIISFDKLYKGLKDSCRNVRWKDSVVGYEQNALKNTYSLRTSLLKGTYKIEKYQRFIIHEPKEREIVATRMRDRQFQHSLCDNGFYEQITKSFIHDNCACLRGRGVDYTLNRVNAHLRRFYTQHGNDGYVLKCDIHHYFASIRHDIAKSAIRKRIKDENMVEHVDKIIDSFGEIGLGLGSQVSQLIALAVLDDMDHFIKEELHIKHYVRYMDDFILIHEDKEYLMHCRHVLETHLCNMGLELNKKTQIIPLHKGFNMLQWRFILTDTGKIIRKMAKKKQSRERRKLKALLKKEAAGFVPRGTARESLRSWLANADRGDTYYERKRMIAYFRQLEVKTYGRVL